MTTGTLTERAVGKKTKQPPPPSSDPPFDRIEFQAEPGWVQKLDAAAVALGVSRSAYIRMACNRQMDRDQREREGK